MNPADPSPFPLAWHPQQPGDRPDPARFVAPSCSGGMRRTRDGLWTSPMVTHRYSAWSIRHDQTGSRHQLVREGWAMAWPDRARTAVIDSFEDLVALVRRFPCKAHLTMDEFLRRGCPVDPVCDPARDLAEDLAEDLPVHDAMHTPPLDYAAMAAEYDAVHLTEAGRQATWMQTPGTTFWDVETVLWLAPAWTLLRPITTDEFVEQDFLDSLLQWALSHRDQSLAPGTARADESDRH